MQLPLEHIHDAVRYSLIGAALVTPLMVLNIRWAHVLGLIDWPKARGLAEDQIPIIGASISALTLGALVLLTLFAGLSPWVMTTAGVMAVVGYFDDRKPIPALDKLFFQLVCAATIIFLDPHIRKSLTDTYGLWGSAVGFFFVVGLINAINFIDGIDGLAGLVLLVGSLGFMLFSHGHAHINAHFILASLIVGMLVPFLYFNVIQRRGFLGNVGSYFLSYLLAMMHLSVPLNADNIFSRFSLTALCFLIPLADSTMVILSRTLTFRSPFQPDKGHLHHRMVQTTIPLRYILLTFGLVEVAGATLAFLINRTPGAASTLIPTVVCLTLVGIAGFLILLLEKASKRRVRTYIERLDQHQPIYFFKYRIQRADGAPLSARDLWRLEARISAEIRISDLCFAQPPQTLIVCLATVAEPLKGIQGRLDTVFHNEGLHATLAIEQAEIVKTPARLEKPARSPRRKAS